MRKYQVGDIAEMYQNLFEELRELVIGLTRNSEIASDIINDTFLWVVSHEQMWKIKSEEVREKYIIDVCVRKCREQLRRDQFRYYYESYDEEMLNQSASYGPYDYILEREILYNAIKKLHPNERKILMQRYFENMGIEDMAEEHGVKAATMLKKIARIRNKLKEILR